MQVGPLSVVMNVSEAPVTAGAEVSGESRRRRRRTPANGRFVLLRQGTRLHGPSAASTIELGLDTEGQYRIWMRVMTDGTAATASGGRARGERHGARRGRAEPRLGSHRQPDPRRLLPVRERPPVVAGAGVRRLP